MKEGKPDLPGGKETILLVDDNEAVWDVLIESLQGLGYSVILAENGVDTVEIYKANPKKIDLVILDMVMPKMGGHSTFFQIKAFDADAKVLLISGYVSEKEVKDLLDAGANGFLSKPCRINVLAREIRRILDKK
ncbi:MAG: response regulator [Victivallales bacterium]|nr:response regulator [Victivallales bacterium]